MAAKRFDRGTIQARAQELIFTSVGISEFEACRRALQELYGNDPEKLLDAAASVAVTTIKSLRRSTYDLADRDQMLVQSMPEYILVDTPEDGEYYKRSADATKDELGQHARRARRHHRTQAKRWANFIERDLSVAEDVPGEVAWGGEDGLESIIRQRKLKALEGGR